MSSPSDGAGYGQGMRKAKLPLPAEMPKAPIYIISKGRASISGTHRELMLQEVPHRVVVEPQEEREYREHNPGIDLIVTPFSNLGQGGIPARNFVWDHAVAEGHSHHWILDDNIDCWRRRFPGEIIRSRINPAEAFAGIERFCARYENIGLAGCEYHMFSPPGSIKVPVQLNRRVFSNVYVNHAVAPARWRGRYNEDTDLSLQVLTSRYWCTFLFTHWLAHKEQSMKVAGGNTTELYADNGRLLMARSLERQWPRLVTTHRVYDRAHHLVRSWRFEQTPIPVQKDTPDG